MLHSRFAVSDSKWSSTRRHRPCLILPVQITVALLPRIPLYGGWSTDFVFGFELPLRSFSGRVPDGRRELLYAFSSHVKGLVTDEQVIRVRCGY